MVLRTSICAMALWTPAMLLGAQTSAGTPATASPTAANSAMPSSNPASAPAVARPSATLQPSLDSVKQAITAVNIDRWKASPAIRSEAQSNLESVQRDLASTLPGLIATADAAPDSAAKTLPVFRNIDALYDVMLRIDAAARLAAPKDQMSALDQSLSALSDARHSLGDAIQAGAEAQDAKVVHLQAQLKAIPPPAPVQAAPVACTPPPPVKKKRPVTKKPTSTSSTSSQNSSSTTTPTH